MMEKDYIGIVVEESLTDNRVLNGLTISKVHITNQINPSDRCHMYEVAVSKEEIEELSRNIFGKWYMHFWKDTDIIAIFNDKIFEFNYEDKDTWSEVLEYGRSLGLPEAQLDFPIKIVELLCKVHFIVNFDRVVAMRVQPLTPTYGQYGINQKNAYGTEPSW